MGMSGLFQVGRKDVLLFHHLMYRRREMNCIMVIMQSMLLEHMIMQKAVSNGAATYT